MGVSVASCLYFYIVDHVTRYNEKKRLHERERVFDVPALQRLAAIAVDRSFEDVLSINKIGEGAANRAFVINFRDGFKLVARIPYPVTQPVGLVVASEAATMAFLRSKAFRLRKSTDTQQQLEILLGQNTSLWSSVLENSSILYGTT